MNKQSQCGVRNSECGVRSPGKGGLLVFYVVVGLALASPAQADYVGLEVVIRNLSVCEDPPTNLEVCNVYAVFTESDDRLMGIGDVNISTTNPAGFFQHSWGGNTASGCDLIPLFPDVVCDSFVTMGLDCVDTGDDTKVDPDFNSILFSTGGAVVGGWYNFDPFNTQGAPDANGRVLIAQFSYKQVKTASGTVDIHTKIGGVNPVIQFALQSFDCAVPGLGPGPCVTLYVDESATGGGNNGNDWMNAFVELQSALDVAALDDQIWVAAGTYEPDFNIGTGMHTGDRTATFQLINGVAIYGGFEGMEDPETFNLISRDFAANETILCGDLADDDDPVSCMADSECFSHGRKCIDGFCIFPNNNDENSCHVVTGSGNDGTAVLDGFTITAGNANAQTGSGFCFEEPPGAPCVDDPNNCTSGPCVLEDAIGGGMINVGGSPKVTNCTFSGNSVESAGGGMYNGGSGATITSCTFDSNQVTDNSIGGAGGMCNNFGSTSKVRNSTFSGNSARSAGGMGNLNGSTPEVTACIFTSNTATLGGGLYSNESSPTVRNTTFSDNSATYGAGLFDIDQSSSKLFNCTFTGNTAVNSGGGFLLLQGSTLEVTNSRFSGNSAGLDGAGILVRSDSAVTVTNCTFSKNTCDKPLGAGMKFNGDGSTSTVNNCVFWGNEGDSDGNQGGPFFDESAQIHIDGVDRLAVTYTDIQELVENGSFDSGSNVGNIGVDPKLVDADSGDVRLSATSPCIDAADNNAPGLVGIFTDFDGNPRFVDDPHTFPDTGNGDAPVVDMGAHEFNPCGLCPSDADDNGEVRVPDLIVLLACWGPFDPQDPNCPCLDVDGSADIRVPDLVALLANWGACP